MLQAESSCARDWDTYKVPEAVVSKLPQAVVGGRKKTTTKVNHKRKIYIKSGIILFGYALILVFLCTSSSSLGYKIGKLEKEIKNLETSNSRIEYEIAQKTSLDRVAQVAVADLGMHKPDANKSIAMGVKAEPINIAMTATSTTDDKSMSQKLLLKVYSSLSRLAQNSY
jgi:cell division protein FtsL